jgi:hypothetical protein
MSHNTDVTIHVKYADKDDAKKMGAWFNAESRSWFIPQGEKHKNYDYLISKYNQPIKKGKKIYLNVPFDDKDDAKTHGAWYDAEKKAWFTWDDNPNKDILIELYN